MADGTVDIAGKKVKKSTAIAGVVVILLVIGVAVYRGRKAGSSAAAPASPGTAAAGSYPPDGTTGNPADLYSTDPATGETYGDEQGGTGYGATGTDAQGYPIGSPADIAWQDTLGGGGGYVAYPVTTTTPGGQTFTTNGQWAQYVEQYMTQTLGANPDTIGAALGKYITGQPVSAAQQSLIEQAIAFAGSPPVAGQNGMPPSINLRASTPPPPPPPARVKVPLVIGISYAEAVTVMHASGLKAAQAGPGVIVQERPAAGTEVKRGSTVTLFGKDK
jgi:hypothetical protein